jgi:deoxyribodipyrimidine photolyase-related protein
MAKTLRLILGDQLNINHSWFQKKDSNITYVLMEVMQEQEYVKHHIQKIVGYFTAMRSFVQELEGLGNQVIYIKLDDALNQQNFEGNIKSLLEELSINKFEYQEPDEYRLTEELAKICKSLKIESAVFESEHFYTKKDDIKNFFKGKKQYLMENFYRDMRKKHALLMDENGDPEGGKWNYDHENRKKYDGKNPLKDPLTFKKDVSELVEVIQQQKVNYFGNINTKEFGYPTTRKEALEVLDYFCKELLPNFGRYEDAMVKEHQTLFHSCLSFGLNIKLISPKEVVDEVLKAYHQSENKIDIAQVEGFVRQVVGWREYMRGLYWAEMPGFANTNFLNHKGELPSWFWDGKVKMNCLKYSINNSLDHAYAHHIQRLMVIGNFALLAGCDPNQVDEWYLGVYIDAIEWVQITNTHGMSQFADGGLVGSKPYVASANYINKMSNYCEGCYYKKELRHGEKACPFNSLYWNFYIKHEDLLAKNPRIGMMYQLIKKMDDTEKQNIINQASTYLENINQL